MKRLIYFGVLAFGLWTGAGMAQNGPLRIEITDGVIEPLTFAVPMFEAENIEAVTIATEMSRIVATDLSSSGLFREVPPSRFIAQRSSFAEPVRYPDWRAINTQALVTAAVKTTSFGRLTVKFRIFDIYSGVQLGSGMQLSGSTKAVRRMAHKVADQVYARITGEGPYFDSKIVFVSESGPKDQRLKRLAIMDYDGENLQFLTAMRIPFSRRASPTMASRCSTPAGRRVFRRSISSTCAAPRANGCRHRIMEWPSHRGFRPTPNAWFIPLSRAAIPIFI